MKAQQSRPKISRRRLLKGAVAAAATAITGAASQRRPSAAQSGDADYQVYLPFIANPDGPHGPSKLGAHTILANNALYWVEYIANAGAHMAAVKALENDLGWMAQVKQVSPQTITVGRFVRFHDTVPLDGDLQATAQELMDRILPDMDTHRAYTDYWEITNEMDPPTMDGYRRHAILHQHLMDIAEREGFKIALFTWNAGTPEWEEMEAVVETGVFGQAREGGHILALHEGTFAPPVTTGYGEPLPGRPRYPDRGTLCCRYRWLYEDFLKPRNEVIPLLMSEFGLGAYADTGLTPEQWVAEVSWFDDRMREDDYVLACCPFTLGPVGQWDDHDWEAALPAYATRIISLKDA
jgi:hypothetical protein